MHRYLEGVPQKTTIVVAAERMRENRLGSLLVESTDAQGRMSSRSRDDKEYLIKADLPEVKKEDVKLTVQDDVMSIFGERKYEKEEKGKKSHRVERAYGSFMRSFTLPEDADGSKVNAEYKDGVLKVHLPKSEKTKPKSIEVMVS